MLFIPTSGYSTPAMMTESLAKGQLYNMDSDRFIRFQFNPETFEYQWALNMATLTGNNDDTGGDLMYINTGPKTIELPLLFMADPGAPDLVYDTEYPLSNALVKMDFHAIEKELQAWTKPIRALGRPSQVMVKFGENTFRAAVVSVNVRQTFFFPDLSVREGMIIIGLREWQMKRAS